MTTNISLSELTLKIKDSINIAFPEKIFVIAEISEINESRGHAYLELVEKDENDQLLAKARATIWSHSYRLIKPYFETSTGRYLEAGLKVLILVNIEFHEVYGLSLNILDIDPNYTLGEIEQKRLAIIRRLEDEGVMEMNKELEIPIVPQKIAVISSLTAAGYEDFINQLENNEFGYKFYCNLYNAAMQGNETEGSIINALEAIYKNEQKYDLVVIIRGGGSKSDLSWFDSYELAINIAQFPLPILTGIGHEKDTSVADLVAFLSLKTPTAVAEYLIGKVFDFDSYLEQLKSEFVSTVNSIILKNHEKLNNYLFNLKPIIIQNIISNKAYLDLLVTKIKNKTNTILLSQRNKITDLSNSMFHFSEKYIGNKIVGLEKNNVQFQNRIFNIINNNYNKLEVYKQKNTLLDPNKVLKRGYSLTTLDGKLIKSFSDVEKNDVVTTKLIDGSFKSKVEN